MMFDFVFSPSFWLIVGGFFLTLEIFMGGIFCVSLAISAGLIAFVQWKLPFPSEALTVCVWSFAGIVFSILLKRFFLKTPKGEDINNY